MTLKFTAASRGPPCESTAVFFKTFLTDAIKIKRRAYSWRSSNRKKRTTGATAWH